VSPTPPFSRRPDDRFEAEDIGQCSWPGCGEPGDTSYRRLIEDAAAEQIPVEPGVFYCHRHAPAAADRALAVLAANQRFLRSDRF